MKEETIHINKEKKKWNLPKIVSLDVKRTEGGPVSYQTEDTAGSIDVIS